MESIVAKQGQPEIQQTDILDFIAATFLVVHKMIECLIQKAYQ